MESIPVAPLQKLESTACARLASARRTSSILLPEHLGDREIGVEGATKAPEGATTGGVTGATIGGVLGWLAGIGSLAISGIGPLIAAGPIVGRLRESGRGALVGALAGYGIPEYEAKRYEDRIHEGGILVSVHSDDSLPGAAPLVKVISHPHSASEQIRTTEASAAPSSQA